MTSDYQPKPSSDQSVASKITYSTGVLNHAVNAKKMTPAIDAGKKDWEDNTDALFVGSKSQAQMTLRTAYDDNYVYLLIERLDYYLNSEGDSAAVFFSNDRKSKTYYKLTLDCNGSPLLEINRDGKFREINLTGIRSSFGINGTVDNDAQMDKGFVYEIAIPRAEIEFANDYILINIIMQNKDGAKKSPSDTFENASILDIETWIPAMFR